MSTPVVNIYLGPYRLLSVANIGQTSRLWQAYHDAERQFFGIKTLQDKFTRDSVQVALLKKEYEVAGSLSHQYIIDIKEYGVDRKVPYLAMEWCAAPNLKMILNRSYDQMAIHLQAILAHMVEAMAYFHSKGWVHRDIKPDNFIFSEETGVKLIDFALATRKKNALSKLFAFKSKKVDGTISYMSPEQIQAKPVDEKADIYSFGCTLFELFAGRPPYAGQSVNELFQKHISANIPPITGRNNNITPEMANLVMMCLAKDPKDRPTSADLLPLMQAVRVFKKTPTNADLKS